jgi:hypothetical protein
MKSKIKNILIIGIGSMGLSHFESFYYSKNPYNIDLHDINIKKIQNKFKDHSNFHRLRFFVNIPKNNKYDVVIISTNSKERYSILKRLLKSNIVNNLILEKFLFNGIKEYLNFKNLIKKYPKIKKINVNVWGQYMVKRMGLKLNKNFVASYHLRKKGLATNLIHILDIYHSLTNNNNFEIISKNLKKIRAKRKGYNELSGNFIIKTNQGLFKIYDNSQSKYHVLKIKNGDKSYILKINKKKQCFFYVNKKLTKIFKFPLAKNYTENFFTKSLNLHSSTKEEFNNYNRISFLSQKILVFVRSKFKRFNLT